MKKQLWTLVLLAAAMTGVACAQNVGNTIWVEGEAATGKNVNPHPWWYDQVQKEQLSGGAWLSNFAEGKDKQGSAEYKINVAAAGKYAFWLRANPTQTKLDYQMNDGAWTSVPAEEGWLEVANIAADGKPDLRFIGWKKLGDFDLKPGPLTLRFKMYSAAQNHGAIDAFVLTTLAWTPRGLDKPGAVAAAVPAAPIGDSWAFNYSGDTLREGSPIDLRYLNEKVAGQSGFVKLSTDGNDFALGDGTPARFWAANVTTYRGSQEDLDKSARFLAKLGVNMVRMHGSFSPKAKDAKAADVDREEIDRCWKLVAAMKKQGIYTTISPFWANAGHAGVKASWGLAGYGDGQDIWGLIFFNDDLRAAYKAWVKELYTKVNPYTGLKLADDPAVGLIQIQNEDGLFFWTQQTIKPEQKAILDKKFAQWLLKKYGSFDKTRAAWDNFSVKEDDFARESVSTLIIWELTQTQSGGKAKRVNDQTQFFAELQRDFYKDIADFYRKDLGCKQLINASNWTTADNEKLGDIERWTYTATDVIAVNRYYNGGAHVGPNTGWRIDPGDFIQSISALKNPTALPTALKQVAGHPTIVTESTWVHPLVYQSEAPFLIAAYQSLSGVDAYYWFSHDKPEYTLDPYFPYATLAGGQKGLFMWNLPPAIETQFPAAALLYRKSYVKQAPVVVHEERRADDLWQRKTPIIVEGKRFDPNRDKTDFAEGSAVKTAVDPLAFLVGRVEQKFDGDPAKSTIADLSKNIDVQNGLVKSATGEITLNQKQGWCVLNTPKAQGATGFLKTAGAINLGETTIDSGNDYATILAVSLDDKALAQSAKVLLQTGTTMRPTGWQTQDATEKEMKGQRIINTGKPPWQVVKTNATITLKNAGLSKATVLDTAGFPKGSVPVTQQNGVLKIQLPPDAIWVVLE